MGAGRQAGGLATSMIFRFLIIIGVLTGMGSLALAQSSSTEHAQDQNETMIDTIKRMQIKREENEHRKLIERAAEIKDNVEALLSESSESGLQRTNRIYDKRLKDIEKYSRQIRSESGGAGDEELEEKPGSLDEALKRLKTASEKLNESIARTSRRVVSVAVINDANEVIQLVRIIRGYLN
ncbi:MAG: hypothetical protein IPG76_07485 [Acidobacteria bacterium]|nr:hypothetical protein [Acidobacteriota bacterium]